MFRPIGTDCYIEVNDVCRTKYGPYRNKDEAEKHLRENGWKHVDQSDTDYWHGRGDKPLLVYMTASVEKVIQLYPRNQLPHVNPY